MKKCLSCGNITLADAQAKCVKCGGILENIISKDDKTQWWYANSGESKGPFTSSEIESLIIDDKIERDDLLWTNGMQNWEPVNLSPFVNAFKSPPPLSASDIDNKFAWVIAFLPILYMFTDFLFHGNSSAGLFIASVCNIIFWMLDKNKLNNAGYKVQKWFWWGLFVVPVYLFVRAYKTNKKYGYAIAWVLRPRQLLKNTK